MNTRSVVPGAKKDGGSQASALVQEVKQWNTPLIGGYLLWRFTQGYKAAHPISDSPSGLLHFVALAILGTVKLNELVSNRRASLESYSRAFEANNNVDLLLSLQQRITEKRRHTLAAIDSAISYGFLVWDVESGKLHARTPPKPLRGTSLRPLLIREGEKAEILGKWFAAHDLPSIASYLKLSF